MKNSPSNPSRWKSILLALICTAVTAGAVLGLTIWVVGGAFDALLSEEDGRSRAAESAETGEQAALAENDPQVDTSPVRQGDEHWRAKERRLSEALAHGRSETFRFSDSELNAMLEEARRQGDFQGRATLKLTDSLLQADIKMPITELPILKGRFLDAQIVLDIALGEDGERLYIKKLVPRSGDWRTRALLKGLQDRDLSEVLEQTSVAQELRSNFQRIAIENKALVLVTRARASAADERRQADKHER